MPSLLAVRHVESLSQHNVPTSYVHEQHPTDNARRSLAVLQGVWLQPTMATPGGVQSYLPLTHPPTLTLAQGPEGINRHMRVGCQGMLRLSQA